MKKDGYTWEDLDKAWWEGFNTCKAKAGEENVKLNDELEKLKKQLEELPDKWCRNKDDYCPHLAKLEKENAELKDKLKNLASVAEVRLANWQKYEKENAELKEKLKPENCLKLLAKEGYIKFTSDNLTKAKELLEKLLITSCNSDVLNLLPNCSEVLKVRVEAEQFLNSEV